MKKICFITTIQLTMDTFVVPFAKVLAENGYDVTYICNMDEEFPVRNGNYAKCIHLPMQRGFHFFDIFKFTNALIKIFKEEKFDAIYYATDNASFYSSIAGAIVKVPVRLYAQWGIHYVAASGLSKLIMQILEKTTCDFSTVIRAQSPKNMQIALDDKLCKPTKIKVLGLGGTIGVDFSEYEFNRKKEFRKRIREKYALAEEDFIFGFVGRVNKDKGCIELLKAFKTGGFPGNVKLMFVGMSDGCEGELAELVGWAKQTDKVIFTGQVKGIEVCQYMSAFDIMVHPTYREGFGKVLQEGLAMGLPIITTDVPGPSEVIEENICGLLVPSQNINILQEKMHLLMQDEQLRESFSIAGRMRAEKFFERSKMINNILVDLDEILGVKRDENGV